MDRGGHVAITATTGTGSSADKNRTASPAERLGTVTSAKKMNRLPAKGKTVNPSTDDR